MTTFVVDGTHKELRYDVDGIDISADFIGNTAHGMSHDEDGNYIATQEDYEWWRDCITAHKKMDATIAAYKEQFDADEVDQVAQGWIGGIDLENQPSQVIRGLERNFGALGQ